MLMPVFWEAEQLELGVQLQAYTHIPFSSRQENWSEHWVWRSQSVRERTAPCARLTLPLHYAKLDQLPRSESVLPSALAQRLALCLVRWCAMNWGIKCRARNLDGNSTHPSLFVPLLLVFLCKVPFFTIVWSCLGLTLIKHFEAFP